MRTCEFIKMNSPAVKPLEFDGSPRYSVGVDIFLYFFYDNLIAEPLPT